MKNQIFLMAIFYLISNAACLNAAINLDQLSQAALLQHALKQSLKDNYWPLGAVVTLKSFEKKADDAYEARFEGRFQMLVPSPVTGNPAVAHMCKPRNALMTREDLNKIGVRLPQ